MDIQDLKKKQTNYKNINKNKKDQIRQYEGKWTLIVNTGFPFQSFVTSLYSTHCSMLAYSAYALYTHCKNNVYALQHAILLLYVHQKHLSQVFTYIVQLFVHTEQCVWTYISAYWTFTIGCQMIFLHYVHRCKRHFFSLKVLTTNLLKFSSLL